MGTPQHTPPSYCFVWTHLEWPQTKGSTTKPYTVGLCTKHVTVLFIFTGDHISDNRDSSLGFSEGREKRKLIPITKTDSFLLQGNTVHSTHRVPLFSPKRPIPFSYSLAPIHLSYDSTSPVSTTRPDGRNRVGVSPTSLPVCRLGPNRFPWVATQFWELDRVDTVTEWKYRPCNDGATPEWLPESVPGP